MKRVFIFILFFILPYAVLCAERYIVYKVDDSVQILRHHTSAWESVKIRSSVSLLDFISIPKGKRLVLLDTKTNSIYKITDNKVIRLKECIDKIDADYGNTIKDMNNHLISSIKGNKQTPDYKNSRIAAVYRDFNVDEYIDTLVASIKYRYFNNNSDTVCYDSTVLSVKQVFIDDSLFFLEISNNFVKPLYVNIIKEDDGVFNLCLNTNGESCGLLIKNGGKVRLDNYIFSLDANSKFFPIGIIYPVDPKIFQRKLNRVDVSKVMCEDIFIGNIFQ